MVGRLIIVAALLVYLGVVGCVVWPGADGSLAAPRGRADLRVNSAQAIDDLPPPPAVVAPVEGLPYRGIAVQVYQVGDVGRYEREVIDAIATTGADTVSLVVHAHQENGTSTRIFLDQRLTLTPEQLVRLIKYAKSKDLRVLLMPIVLPTNPRGDEWRGTLKPDSWEDWFDSYREIMRHYAIIAQTAGVDVLSVGSELVSSESRLEQWTRTIRLVRSIYKGRLTYSANWDAYTRTPFWDQLDLAGMNSYYTLGDDHRVSVEEIVRRWRSIQRDLVSFQRRVNRPIIFTEVGWCSISNAAHEPWDYTKSHLPIDLDLQRKLYQGFFEAWHGQPGLGGFMFWEWPLGDGGPNDKGYTPEGKPAEKVLREWLGKPWK